MLWNKINKISKKILKIIGIELLMALAVSIGDVLKTHNKPNPLHQLLLAKIVETDISGSTSINTDVMKQLIYQTPAENLNNVEKDGILYI